MVVGLSDTHFSLADLIFAFLCNVKMLQKFSRDILSCKYSVKNAYSHNVIVGRSCLMTIRKICVVSKTLPIHNKLLVIQYVILTFPFL